MAGDLDDFLRRAAQRRQAKAVQQKQQQADRRSLDRSTDRQYTNSRTERQARSIEDVDEILTAELVEDDAASVTSRMRRLDETRRAAARAEAEAAERIRKAGAGLSKAAKAARDAVPTAKISIGGEELLALLRRPEGIRQAILMREILDRPEHRW